MAAYAEGLNILRHADVGLHTQRAGRRDDTAAPSRAVPVRAQPGRRGRGVAPRQRHQLVAARPHGTGLRAGPEARARSPGGCRTRARAAGRASPPSTRAVPAPVLTTALFERFSSRGEADFADKVLSAMRFGFGGHLEKKAADAGAVRRPGLLRRHRRPRLQADLPGAGGADRERGKLDVPIIGVAKQGWNLDQLKQRRPRQPGRSRARVDEAPFAKLTVAAAATSTATTTTRRRSPQLRQALGNAKRPCHYLAIPPSLFETVAEAPRRSRASADGARIVVEKPFGHDLRQRRGAERHDPPVLPRGPGLPHRPLPRQGAGAEPALHPLRQHVPRADLEPQLRRQRADHDGRGLRRGRPRRVLRRHRLPSAT